MLLLTGAVFHAPGSPHPHSLPTHVPRWKGGRRHLGRAGPDPDRAGRCGDLARVAAPRHPVGPADAGADAAGPGRLPDPTLRMLTRIVDAVGDWATSLVFNPTVWLGIVLAGISGVLFVVTGMMRDRQLNRSRGGEAAPPRPARSRPELDQEKLPPAASTRASRPSTTTWPRSRRCSSAAASVTRVPRRPTEVAGRCWTWSTPARRRWAPGRLVCIDGPAGAGKTTLAAEPSAAAPAPPWCTWTTCTTAGTGLPRVGDQLDTLLRRWPAGRPGPTVATTGTPGRTPSGSPWLRSRCWSWRGWGPGHRGTRRPGHAAGRGSRRPPDLRLRRGLERDGEAFAPHGAGGLRGDRLLRRAPDTAARGPGGGRHRGCARHAGGPPVGDATTK